MRPRVNNPFQAVTPTHGSVAPSSKDRFFGKWTTPCSFSVAYCVSMPSRLPPSAPEATFAGGRPPSQFWKKVPATRSPTRKRVTPCPTATISPAPSDNGTRLSREPTGYCPFMTNTSRRLRDVARTRIRTSCAPGNRTVASVNSSSIPMRTSTNQAILFLGARDVRAGRRRLRRAGRNQANECGRRGRRKPTRECALGPKRRHDGDPWCCGRVVPAGRPPCQGGHGEAGS